MQDKLFGLLIAILGLMTAIVPAYILPPCAETLTTVSGASVPMKCFWSVRAELGIGFLLCSGAILSMLFSSIKARLALSLMLFLTSLLAIAVPAFLIGGCKMEIMTCQVTTFPAIFVLSGITAFTTLVNTVYLYHKVKKVENL